MTPNAELTGRGPIKLRDMNRKKRKKLARLFKFELQLDRIPCARLLILNQLKKEMAYMCAYEKYANW